MGEKNKLYEPKCTIESSEIPYILHMEPNILFQSE